MQLLKRAIILQQTEIVNIKFKKISTNLKNRIVEPFLIENDYQMKNLGECKPLHEVDNCLYGIEYHYKRFDKHINIYTWY